MPLYRLDTLSTRELFPGFTARLIHTPRITQSFVTATAGSTFPSTSIRTSRWWSCSRASWNWWWRANRIVSPLAPHT